MLNLLVTQAQDRVADVCRQFGETTGWPLEYRAVDGADPQVLEERLKNEETCCWTYRVEDSQGCRGLLALHLPKSPELDQNFNAVSALAEQIGGLISHLSQAIGGLETTDREVLTLASLGLNFRTNQPLPEVLHQLLTAVLQLTDYKSAAFYLLNPATNKLRLRSAVGLDADTMPATARELSTSGPDLEALVRSISIVQRTSLADDRWLPTESQLGVCVAVQSATVPMGTLWVFDRRQHLNPERDARVLQGVAAHIASALERAVYVRESEAQQRLAHELKDVSEGQSNGLRIDLPATCGFATAARCVSRYQVGGDLVELLSLTNQTTGIAVGDASGNNFPAALVMNAVRGSLRTVSGRRGAHDWHPAVTMERINQALHPIIGAQQFMSMFYGVYDSSTRAFTYTNAGHPCPLLFRGSDVVELDPHGLILGVMNDATYSFSVLELLPGDMLVLYTDGITETMNDAEQLFGQKGIIRAVRGAVDTSVDGVLESIWTQAEQFCSERARRKMDDRTLLVLRFE